MLQGVDKQTGQRLDDTQIRDETIIFLIAGHETTSGLLSFAVYALLNNPEALAKAQEPCHPDYRERALHGPCEDISWDNLEYLAEESPDLVARRWEELKRAAREIRRQQRHENRARRDDDRWDWYGDGNVDVRLAEFLDRTSRVLRRVRLTEAQVRECAAILDEAFDRIRQVLRDTGERPPTDKEHP